MQTMQMTGKCLSCLSFVTAAFLAGWLGGCEQPTPGVTYSKDVNVWPFYTLKKMEGKDESNHIKWYKENGSCCILAGWEKEKRVDAQGFVIYRKEKSVFFPIAGGETEESEQAISKQGMVLLFPYKSYRDKTATPK